MDDYQRVAEGIEYLRQHRREQPTLEAVAASVHLSPDHFQRVFSRWAGVSPKRFLQLLTLEDLKSGIRQQGLAALAAAEDSGLSSSSRAHDHFVHLEAVTPGEYKSGGLNLEIRYGVGPTPFGDAFIAVTDRGVCALAFLQDDLDAHIACLKQEWPFASCLRDDARARRQLALIFARKASDAPLSVLVKGSNFQVQVWRALLRVPSGQTCSYGDVASALGSPRASRAVGSAVAANSIAWLIPCHRVIQKSGVLGNYRWGGLRKNAMLVWEAARCDLADG